MNHRIWDHPIVKHRRGNEIHFTFDGEAMIGFEGEFIATALLANGVKAFRVTEKHKYKRGIFCGIGQCNDCVVVVDGVPNVRSCVTRLRSGMVIETQVGLGELGKL